MAEYIDRSALGIGKAKREAFTIPEYADGWNEAIKIIDNAQTVDAVEVVRCKECVYWMPRHVKMNDGTIRFYETNEGIVTIEKGINVGSYCKRFDDVTVHGYRDGEPCIDKTKAWCNKDDFCSYGERRTDEQ